MIAADTGRSCKVLRQPQGIDEARRFAELAVTYCEPECREAAAMVVTELAENIVKYGAEGQGVFAGAISIALESGVLRVSASNDVTSPQEAQTVKDVIAHIASSSDVKALYRSRLEELFRNPDLERAQLGLLRAAYEGGFRLSCQYSAPKLVVIAERRCGGR